MISYIFDGSFAGLLCCVFRAYEFKDKQVRIYSQHHFQPELFAQNLLAEEVVIATDDAKAERVWTALSDNIGSNFSRRVHFTYLSEQAQAFQYIFDFACYVFDHVGTKHANSTVKGRLPMPRSEHGLPQLAGQRSAPDQDARAKSTVHYTNLPHSKVYQNYGHPAVLGVSQIAKSVSREKHRMEAFVRFKKTAEGIFFAVIDPDFNVLPLISPHFKSRYADQRWMIYDEKRRYGLFYDLSRVHEVKLANATNKSMIEQAQLTDTSITLDAQEALYDQLWKDYFKSTNIVERRNIKLHLQHVPKRYWKYLTEKN